MAHPVPAAIDALVALWTGPTALAYTVDADLMQLRVVDGPPTADLDDRRALFVGTGAQYVPGGAQITSGYDLAGRSDLVEIVCQLHVWSGDTDPAVVRTQAYAVLDVLIGLLAASRNLGGVVDWARVLRSTYEPMQDEAGAAALIEFTVRVDAHRDHEG